MWLEELRNDINNIDLPENLDSYNKIKTELVSGKRIYWYYNSDLEYCKEFDLDPKRDIDIYSGLVIPLDGIEYNGGEIEVEHAIIVLDHHPCEKSYPEVAWISLKRILNDDDLIEIFAKNRLEELTK